MVLVPIVVPTMGIPVWPFNAMIWPLGPGKFFTCTNSDKFSIFYTNCHITKLNQWYVAQVPSFYNLTKEKSQRVHQNLIIWKINWLWNCVTYSTNSRRDYLLVLKVGISGRPSNCPSLTAKKQHLQYIQYSSKSNKTLIIINSQCQGQEMLSCSSFSILDIGVCVFSHCSYSELSAGCSSEQYESARLLTRCDGVCRQQSPTCRRLVVSLPHLRSPCRSEALSSYEEVLVLCSNALIVYFHTHNKI